MRLAVDHSDARILIIDDEATNLKLLDKVLTAHGYRHIELIQYPDQAIAAYQACRPDIILLDLQMPAKDGFTLLEEFKALQDPLLPPIVVLTAYQEKTYRLKALQAGARDFLTKPFDQIELLARIRNLIEMQRHITVVRRQNSILEQENLLAQNLYEKLLGNTGHDLAGIHCFHRPASLFSGDLLLASVSPASNDVTVLLADAMGHGLAAAISLMPMSMLFHAAVKQNHSVSELATELNMQLNKLLPDDRFVAAMILKFDFANNTMSIWSGGMPPALCINRNTKSCTKFSANHMALGILPPALFQTDVIERPITSDETIIVYSDGLTEALSPQQDYFKQVLEQISPSLCDSEHPLQVICAALNRHLLDSEPADDIFLAEIDIASLARNTSIHSAIATPT